MKNRIIIVLVLTVLNITDSFSQIAARDLESFSTIGKQSERLQSGNEEVLYEKNGKGLLHHMWFGGGFEGIENTVIRVYVDNEKEPSIEMKMSEGFANAYHSSNNFQSSSIIGKTGEKGGVYNTFQSWNTKPRREIAGLLNCSMIPTPKRIYSFGQQHYPADF